MNFVQKLRKLLKMFIIKLFLIRTVKAFKNDAPCIDKKFPSVGSLLHVSSSFQSDSFR